MACAGATGRTKVSFKVQIKVKSRICEDRKEGPYVKETK